MARKIKEAKIEVQANQEDFNKEIENVKNWFKKIDKSYFVTAAIILIILLVMWAGYQYGIKYTYDNNNFIYHNISFNKNYEGEIIFYTAKIPVYDSNKNIHYLSIDFRNDPRLLEDMDISFDNEYYNFLVSNKTYVSYESTNKSYKNGALAGANLGRFLALIGLDVKAAMSNSSYKNNSNLPFITCKTNTNNTVIMLYESSKSRIEQASQNCYILLFKEGEILEVTERFELAVLEKIFSR